MPLPRTTLSRLYSVCCLTAVLIAIFFAHKEVPHIAQSQLKLPPWRRHRVVILPSALNSDPRQSLPSRSQTAYPNCRIAKPFAFTVPVPPSTLHPASIGSRVSPPIPTTSWGGRCIVCPPTTASTFSASKL